MSTSQLTEIVVRAEHGEDPTAIANMWAQRLTLADGVRVSVEMNNAIGRPRRFVIYNGAVTTTQHYAAIMIAEQVEELLQKAEQALDAWGVLQYARQNGSPVAQVPMATISRAARLLEREGRLRRGTDHGTWRATRESDAAA